LCVVRLIVLFNIHVLEWGTCLWGGIRLAAQSASIRRIAAAKVHLHAIVLSHHICESDGGRPSLDLFVVDFRKPDQRL